jgi:PAS domain S-box-containing protein
MFSILYVDDEPGLLEIGQLFLENTGEFTVMTVDSGEEALGRLSRTDFDAVISDYQMPGMDGIELLKRVRKTYGALPFILFTGRGREEIVIEAINNGADSYLQKGGDPQTQFAELGHRVRQAIQRRRAEIALSDSERRFADIINFLPDATFAIDTEGHVIAWNRAIEEMTGIPAQEMLGKGNYEYAVAFYGSRRPVLIDLVFEPDEKIGEDYVDLRRDGSTISAETSLPHPKGKRIDALAKASPLFNRDGEITGAIEAIRDISDRKRSEEELRAANEQLAASGEELRAQYNELAESERRIRESEENYRSVIDNIQDMFYRSNRAGNLIMASPSCLRKLGYGSFDEIVNKPIAETFYYSPEKRKELIRIITEKGATEDFEVQLKRKDGTPLWVSTSSHYYRDESGAIAGIEGIFRDITERKRVEEILRKSEADLKRAEEIGKSGSWELQLNEKVFEGSKGAQIIYGLEGSRWTIEEIQNIPLPEYRPLLDAALRDLIAGKSPYNIEFKIRRPTDGAVLDIHSFAEFDPGRNIVFGVIHDITGSKRAEMELRTAYEQISASAEELREQYEKLSSAQRELSIREQQMVEIAATVPGVIFQFYARPDGSTGIYYVSTLSEKIFGFDNSTTDYIRWFTDRLHPDDRERFEASIRDAVQAGTRWEFEGRFTKSGETIWFRGISSPVRHRDELVFSGVLLDITEQKRAEEVLRESEEKYRSLIETTNTGYVILDETGKVLDANPEYVRLTGHRDLGEIAGRDVIDWTAEYDRERNAAAVRQCFHDGFIRNFEIDYTDSAAHTTPIEINATVVHEKGKSRIITLCREISDRRKAMAALRESEERYRTLTGFAFDGVLIQDFNGTILSINPTIQRLFGIPDESALAGKTVIDFVLPEERESVVLDLQDIIAGKGGHLRMYQARAPDGRDLWLEAIGARIRYREQDAIIIAVRDITDQKRSAKALEESERRYRLLTENSPDMIYFIDADGYIRYVNEYAARSLRSRPAELVGKHLSDLFDPETTRRHTEGIRDVIASRQPSHREMREVLPAGEIWLDVRLSPLVDEKGAVLGVLGLSHDISDRKNAEESLLRLSRQDQVALDVARMAYFEFEVATQTFIFNDQYYALVGTTAEKAGGYRMPAATFADQFFHPENAHFVEDYIRMGIETPDPRFEKRFESRIIRPDGAVMWVDIWFRIEKDPAGKTVRFYGVSQDITERKHAEEALQRSYALLKGVIESPASVVIFALDRQYRYIAFNENHRLTMKLIWGRDIMPGTCMPEYIRDPADRAKAIASFDRAIAGESFTVTEEYGDPAPGRRVYENTYNPIVDESGKVIGLTVFLTDITDRTLAEKALHESETKYRMLVESSYDIIYTLSTEGILTFVSPSWTVLLGHPTNEVIGKSFRRFIHPDDVPACLAFVANVVKTRERQSGITYRVFHADGSIHIHISNISPVLDDKGTLVSYIGNAHDITDTKRSENAIRESNRKLNLLNSITRHDLANQLTVVLGYTQLAMLRKPDPVIAEFIGKIEAAAGVMQRQIEFTRNYQELGVQAPAWHNVCDVVMAVKPQGITLTCTCDACEVFADPMIGKVFFNLFDNAIRHGGRVSAITVQCGQVSGEMVITVEDNGVGIPLNEKQKIFEKGYGKNTGFGLFLVREILAITGIFIHETGAHGRGARFEIAVPKGAYRTVKKEEESRPQMPQKNG